MTVIAAAYNNEEYAIAEEGVTNGLEKTNRKTSNTSKSSTSF